MNRPQIATLLSLAAVFVTALAFSAEDAGQKATAILQALSSQPEAERVASETIGRAKQALRRASQMRASADQQHGAMLEETALEWATTSELLARTARSEKELFELQSKTTELETKVFRAQALVEQTVARRARAEEALRKLDAQGIKP